MFYNFNFGSKTINIAQFLTGKHFLSRFVLASKGLLFLFSQEMFFFSHFINVFNLLSFRLKVKTAAFLIPAYLSSVSYLESGFSSFSPISGREKILFCLNDYNSSFFFNPKSYYIKVLFSFSFFREEEVFKKDLFFDYVFPLLNPFEENNVYIDCYGNLLRPWGGVYNGQIASNVIKTLDLCYNLFITFFSSNLWNYKILELLKFYKSVKNITYIDKFSSNLNIINARKIFKIY